MRAQERRALEVRAERAQEALDSEREQRASDFKTLSLKVGELNEHVNKLERANKRLKAQLGKR
jgi:hypothetical protein